MLQPIDIIDRNNRPTGELSNPAAATNRGLWHRGARVILVTPDKKILVQKRSLNTIQRPGMVDIGVAGFVDSGETPRQTAARETLEETGLVILPSELIFLGTSRYNHHWRFGKRKKISRTIIYTYLAKLPHTSPTPQPQKDEVAWVGFLPLKSALWLIHHGSLKRLGTLIPLYAYYRKTINQALKFIDA